MEFPKSFCVEELVKAANECSKGVKWKESITSFLDHILERCIGLQHMLETGTYRLNNYNFFKVYEPKVRQISSQAFVDRVVQRSLCNNGVYDDLTRFLIYDNGACVKNKGTEFMIGRLKCLMQRQYRVHHLSGYVIHIDIRRYFPNIPHGFVKSLIWSKVKDPFHRNELYRVVDSFKAIPVGRNVMREPENVGIPLGSQLSQLFALGALDPVDKFIKERLNVEFYIRYMDDLILVVNVSKEDANRMLNRIIARIEALGFEVNKKTMITPFRNGIRFMKRVFNVHPVRGSILTHIDHTKFGKERRKLRAMLHLIARNGKFTINDLVVHYQGWRHYMCESGSYGIVKQMDDYLRHLISYRPDFKSFVFMNKFDGVDPKILTKFI